MATQRLTDAFCKALSIPPKGNYLSRCSETRGFAIRVTAAGNKAFVFCYSAAGRSERRMTIGPFGAWSAAAARKRAEELRRLVNLGDDPLEARRENHSAKTMRGLWEWYSAGPLLQLGDASQVNVRRAWSSKIEPSLGCHTKVGDLHRHDIQKMVDQVTKQFGPVAANRCHSYVRRMLNLAVAEGFVTENVATRSIQRNQEHSRQRYLKPDELRRLFNAIETCRDRSSGLALKLLILTGARRSEILGMRWSEIDFEGGTWTKPPSRTKQRRVHHVPLSAKALGALRELQNSYGSGDFVFPSRGKLGHLTEIRRTWRAVLKAAGITGCRIHDLRHSFASVIASKGGSLETIGALLGHSQTQTTQRYTHMFDETLRGASELVADATRYQGEP